MRKAILEMFMIFLSLFSCQSHASDKSISEDLSPRTDMVSSDTTITNQSSSGIAKIFPVSYETIVKIDPPYSKALPERPCWIKDAGSLERFKNCFPELETQYLDDFAAFDFSSNQYLCITIKGPSAGHSNYRVTGIYQTKDEKNLSSISPIIWNRERMRQQMLQMDF